MRNATTKANDATTRRAALGTGEFVDSWICEFTNSPTHQFTNYFW